MTDPIVTLRQDANRRYAARRFDGFVGYALVVGILLALSCLAFWLAFDLIRYGGA